MRLPGQIILPIGVLVVFAGVFWWGHHRMVREHWASDSICGRRVAHGIDSWAAWLNFPAPAKSDNFYEQQKANQEAVQKWREAIAQTDEQTRADFEAVIASISAAVKMGVANDAAACMIKALPENREALFDAYARDVNARIKLDGLVCQADADRDVAAYLIHHYPCGAPAAETAPT